MRTIKFRAWENNKMRYDFWQRCDLGNYLNSIGVFKDVKIMQFTGLKNPIKKDGFNEAGNYKTYKDLYESDIVEFTTDTEFYLGKNLKGEKFVICYQSELGGGWCLKHISTFMFEDGCNIQRNGWKPIDPYTFSNLIHHFEVIGNIYQHKHLL